MCKHIHREVDGLSLEVFNKSVCGGYSNLLVSSVLYLLAYTLYLGPGLWEFYTVLHHHQAHFAIYCKIYNLSNSNISMAECLVWRLELAMFVVRTLLRRVWRPTRTPGQLLTQNPLHLSGIKVHGF